MDATKVVNNIVAEAFEKAERDGDPKFVVAEAVLEVYLGEAIDAIDKRNAAWFYDTIKKYDHD